MAETTREILEKAFEEQEEGTEEVRGSEEGTEEPVGAAEAQAEEGEREQTEESGGESEATAEDEAAESVAAEEQESEDGLQETQRQQAPAPQSWKPGVREQWAKLPKEVQDEVLRREKNINDILQHTADQRKFMEDFQSTIRPFEPLIASQNATPMEAVKNLMTTAAGLTIGTPQQKAQIVAQVIGQYGVDINMLDQLLAGQAPAVSPEMNAMNQMLEQRLAPMNQFMQNFQHQQENLQQQQATEMDHTLEQFGASHEFFEDLRLDMADIMELAANRGQTLELEEAYNRAIAMNPEINRVVHARAAQAQAQQRSSQVEQKRAAASSVASAGGGGAPAAPETLRGAIEAAFDGQ